MKPSEQVKAAGLKNLKELSTIAKVSSETLVNWSKNRPEVFRLLIAGVVAEKKMNEVKLNNSDKLEVMNNCLLVNGRPFVVDYPNEQIHSIEDNRLVTLFRGHLYNHWRPEEILGYYA